MKEGKGAGTWGEEGQTENLTIRVSIVNTGVERSCQ